MSSFRGCVRFSRERRLHGLNAEQTPVDVHRVQQWLIEPCLVFFRDKQNLVLGAWRNARAAPFRGYHRSSASSVYVLSLILSSMTVPENATSVRIG